MSLIRYPGSKAKLADAILSMMPDELLVPLWLRPDVHYYEPFIGSGAVAFAVMRNMHHKASVTLADADIGIVSLWQSVRDNPRELQKRIWDYEPTVDSFYELKAQDGTFTDTVDTGFRKLALHRISVSGFGAMAGGPIGGRHQRGDYNVDCRWRPSRMKKSIDKLHRLFSKFSSVEIKHQHVFDTLASAGQHGSSAVVYLDPPYYEKGDQLYAVKFSDEEHAQLAATLRMSAFWWALSYDDHPRIRELYDGLETKRLELVYTNAVTKNHTRRKNHEILILSPNGCCSSLSNPITCVASLE